MHNHPSNLIKFPATGDQAVADQLTRRRGNATQLLCNCCPLPFAETMGQGSLDSQLVGAVSAEAINIYSRHYGTQHSNRLRLGPGVQLLVTDRREFVIVPIGSEARLVA
jgi:hypothetical protein